MRQDHLCVVVRNAETNLSRNLLLVPLLDDAIVKQQDLPGLKREPAAAFREGQVPPPFHEQLLPDQLFEPLHLSADRRLCSTDQLRRTFEAACICKGNECAKQVHIEIDFHVTLSII